MKPDSAATHARTPAPAQTGQSSNSPIPTRPPVQLQSWIGNQFTAKA